MARLICRTKRVRAGEESTHDMGEVLIDTRQHVSDNFIICHKCHAEACLRQVLASYITSQLARSIGIWKESKKTATENASYRRPNDDIKPSCIELPSNVSSCEDTDDCYDSTWNLQKSRFVIGKAEGADQYALEASNCTIGDRRSGRDQGQEPGLRVFRKLKDLRRLEVLESNQ